MADRRVGNRRNDRRSARRRIEPHQDWRWPPASPPGTLSGLHSPRCAAGSRPDHWLAAFRSSMPFSIAARTSGSSPSPKYSAGTPMRRPSTGLSLSAAKSGTGAVELVASHRSCPAITPSRVAASRAFQTSGRAIEGEADAIGHSATRASVGRQHFRRHRRSLQAGEWSRRYRCRDATARLRYGSHQPIRRSGRPAPVACRRDCATAG